jgi:hypothetical protein
MKLRTGVPVTVFLAVWRIRSGNIVVIVNATTTRSGEKLKQEFVIPVSYPANKLLP